jgi:hypothetical protein
MSDLARTNQTGELDQVLNTIDPIVTLNVDEGYDRTRLTAVDTVSGGEVANAVESLFNPLYLFRYAKFSELNGGFDASKLKDSGTSLGQKIRGVFSPKSLISKHKKDVIENPSATEIINWARENTLNDNTTTISPTPYQWNDFLWCKWYGKIPNNRLITLRRYPIPVEDNLQINKEKLPLIPLAQAVTWWGDDTGNSLGNIFGFDFGLKWSNPLKADVKDVEGNEVAVDDLFKVYNDVTSLFGGTGANITSEQAKKVIASTFFTDSNELFAGTGVDERVKEWTQAAYGAEGPYWNRVLGPVNVINETKIRERGMTFNHEIKLKFSYKLRAYGKINPKIAFLDLLSNLLSLTYKGPVYINGAY